MKCAFCGHPSRHTLRLENGDLADVCRHHYLRFTDEWREEEWGGVDPVEVAFQVACRAARESDGCG